MWKRYLLLFAFMIGSPAFGQDMSQETHRVLEFDTRTGGSILVSHSADETRRLETSLGLRLSGSSDFVAFTGAFATEFATAIHSYGARVVTYGEGNQRVLVLNGRSAIAVKHLLAATYGYDLVFANPFCIIKGGVTALLDLVGHVAGGLIDLGIDVAEISAAFMYCTLQTALYVASEVAAFAGGIIVMAVDGTVFMARFAAYQILQVVRIGARGAIFIAHSAVVGAYRLVDGVLRVIRHVLDRLFDGLLNPFGRPCHLVYVY